MEARSTNTMGRWAHFGGDVAAGVNDGVAIILRSASTGGTAIIEPLSDSDTAALTIRAKGAADLTIGNSSNAVVFAGSGFKFGTGSTTALALVQRYTVEFKPPDIGASTGVVSTVTLAGLTTNAVLVFTARMPVNPCYSFRVRCSTASELCFDWTNGGGSSQSDSTNRGTLLAFNF
jgi:hypothetical protein